MYIYHIVEQSTWNQAVRDGIYLPQNFMREGFIHCSTREQVLGVANRFYTQDSNLVLLQIDVDLVASQIVEENLEGGSEKFPHIYGALNMDAVKKALAFEKNDDGKFRFPLF